MEVQFASPALELKRREGCMISTLEMGKRNGHPLVVEIKQTSGVLDSAFLVVSENC